MLSFAVSFNDAELAKIMKQAAKDRASKAIDAIVQTSLPQCQALFMHSLTRQPEYESLISGKLRYHFGLVNSQDVDSVVDAATLAVKIRKMPAKGDSLGGVSVEIVNTKIMESLAANTGYNSSKSGTFIAWLKWLLLSGDNIIITGYEIKIDERLNYKTSRTKHALMVRRSFSGLKGRYNRAKGRSAEGSNFWRVPPEFAGTPENNWFTRAAVVIAPTILDMLNKKLEKAFNG